MSARKAPRRQAPCFRELINDLPIAGTPAPLPCPFCGDVEMVGVVIGSSENGTTAHVECNRCGAEMGGATFDASCGLTSTYAVVKEACRLWNTRTGVKS